LQTAIRRIRKFFVADGFVVTIAPRFNFNLGCSKLALSWRRSLSARGTAGKKKTNDKAQEKLHFQFSKGHLAK
jgi:hypothetical protein